MANLPGPYSKEMVTTTVTVAIAVALGIFLYRRTNKTSVPRSWRPVGKVKGLFLYPLKGGRRNELEKAVCSEYGFQEPQENNRLQLRDRCLQIYNEEDNKNFTHKKCLLIKTTAIDEDHFAMNVPGMPQLVVKIPTNDKKTASEFWTTEEIATLDCGDEAARWISTYIFQKDSGLRIGYHDGTHKREVYPAFKKYIPVYPNLKQTNAMGMYSNISSYMLLGQSSVDDVCRKSPEKTLTAHNFRCNILVENAAPFAEDDWKWVKIGDVILYSVKPCTRCSATTYNQETAEKNQNNEPLRTLRQYRRLADLKNEKLDGYRSVMGSNMGIYEGVGRDISVGDVVYVG